MLTVHDAAIMLLDRIPTPIPDDPRGDRAYALKFARDAAYAGEDWEAVAFAIRMLSLLGISVEEPVLDDITRLAAGTDYVEEIDEAIARARKTLHAA